MRTLGVNPSFSESPADPLLGSQIAGRYDLVRLLGQGGMGRVYLAQDRVLGNLPVALKMLSQAVPGDLARKRFAREAQACALLSQRSLHVVRVSDFGFTDDGLPYYVMEYLQGRTLREVMVGGPLSLARFLNLSRQICLGLQQVHAGLVLDGRQQALVHRDLKPSNILVLEDASLGELVKVLDFGIAKFLGEQGTLSLQTVAFVGTLAYASPEQMEGLELDARSDIYSLGLILYELLSGVHPFQGQATSSQSDISAFAQWYRAHREQQPPDLRTLPQTARLPLALCNLVMACLAKQPDRRPQGVGEILATLDRVQGVPSVPLDGATVPWNPDAPAPIAPAPPTSTLPLSQAPTDVVAPAPKPAPRSAPRPVPPAPVPPASASAPPVPRPDFAALWSQVRSRAEHLPRLPRPVLWGGGAAILVLLIGLAWSLRALQTATRPGATPAATPSPTPSVDQEALEAKFRDSLLKASQSDMPGARADCEAVIQQASASVLGRTCGSFLAILDGQWAKAVSESSAAIKLDPQQAVAYNNRGAAYYFQDKLALSIQDLNRAIQLNPSYVAPYNFRAVVLGKQGKTRQALQDCQKAIELNPRYLDAYNTCGNLQADLGAWSQALGHYNRAIALGSRDPVVYTNRGVIYNRLGDNRSARKDLQTALGLVPADNPELRDQISKLLAKLK